MKKLTVPCVFCGRKIDAPGCIFECTRENCKYYDSDGYCLHNYDAIEGHLIRIPRVVIKSITGDDSEAFGESLKEATAVYIDGKFVGSGVYFGSDTGRFRCRDFEWVEGLLLNLCKALEIPVAIDTKTVTPEEWGKIVR